MCGQDKQGIVWQNRAIIRRQQTQIEKEKAPLMVYVKPKCEGNSLHLNDKLGKLSVTAWQYILFKKVTNHHH